MPVIHADQAAVHKLHSTSFTAYASAERDIQISPICVPRPARG